MSDEPRDLVVCFVGTDHHPFERLVSWCDALATSRPDVDVVVQHGLTSPPRVASGKQFFSKEELVTQLGQARVAISHGGPGLISEIRTAGLQPIVVPRDPARGEHIDGHQLRFVDRMARSSLIDVVSTQESFMSVVGRRLARTCDDRIDTTANEKRVRSSVDRFAGLIEQLLDERS